MIELQFPGEASPRHSPLEVSAESGMLIVVAARADLDRLILLCSTIRGGPGPATRLARRDESGQDDRLRQLAGDLLSGRLPADEASPPIDPGRLHAQDPFDALILGLSAVASLWGAEEHRLVLCLALAMPGAGSGDAVAIRLAEPRAALWLTSGSIVAGISVGVALKAARWGAIVASTITSSSADAAAAALIEGLRTRAAVASRHGPLPRLDKLTDRERASLRSCEVLVVLLHGLFATDVGTFDGFISRLRQTTPGQLDAALEGLAKRAPGVDGQSVGIAALLASFRQALERGGDRVAQVDDLASRRFVEAHVGLVGWPHDSLAPVETCATELAAMLDKEFGSGLPQRVVFVCHSQGGLLARAAAIALSTMKTPTARWSERVAAIATFGTPHRGAAIAEPGGAGGREAAAFLMMLRGTGRPTSLADTLTLMGARTLEGIEDVKAFNATTRERETSYVHRLLKEELGCVWPNGGRRPDMLLVGGRAGAAQTKTWRDRWLAAFVRRKLGDGEHDLVVELTSSLADLLDPRFGIVVECDHFGYFDDNAPSAIGLDAAVALVWSLLGDRVAAWPQAMDAAKRADAWPAPASFKIKLRLQAPTPPGSPEPGPDAAPSAEPPEPSR